MYKTIRSLTVLAFIASAVACGGEPAVGGDDSNVEKGSPITATFPETMPGSTLEFGKLLRSDAKGRLACNASVGGWEYMAVTATAPIKGSKIVAFKQEPAGSPTTFDPQQSLEVEDRCGGQTECESGGCTGHQYSITGESPLVGGQNVFTGTVTIDGKPYTLLSEIAPIGGSYGFAFGARDKTTKKETVQFTLKRHYKGM